MVGRKNSLLKGRDLRQKQAEEGLVSATVSWLDKAVQQWHVNATAVKSFEWGTTVAAQVRNRLSSCGPAPTIRSVKQELAVS